MKKTATEILMDQLTRLSERHNSAEYYRFCGMITMAVEQELISKETAHDYMTIAHSMPWTQ